MSPQSQTTGPTPQDPYRERVVSALNHLTIDIQDRSAGSRGNRAATAYFNAHLKEQGWATEVQRFDAMDWKSGNAILSLDNGSAVRVFPSPYSLGCKVSGALLPVSTMEELEKADAAGSILLLNGAIAREALMPKNFPFYSDENQQRLIALLESSSTKAVLAARPAHAMVSGGVYPAPFIEDGDFEIPSAYMTEDESLRLLPFKGQDVSLFSDCYRIQSSAANIVGRINSGAPRRIVITAHIDAKKDIPGALDNATGVAALLLLSDLLAGYKGRFCIELVALNGEDHYAVPGQIAYMRANQDLFCNIALNINIDGIGYIQGKTAYSFFELLPEIRQNAIETLLDTEHACEGVPWFQGDHSMFMQAGCPAIAVTSNWLLENMTAQTVTHTSNDRIDLVDPGRVVSCALAIKRFVETIS